MKRYDVINHLISRNGYKSYLEIGYDYGTNYEQIECESKECCEPYPKEGTEDAITYRMTSDEMFASVPEDKKWDIVFIDGLHLEEYAGRDIINSLKHLNPGGRVIVHDCLPYLYEHTLPTFEETNALGLSWYGTVYKAMCELSKQGIRFYTINTDFGIGVIEYYEHPELLHYPERSTVDFKTYFRNWSSLMNSVEEDEFVENGGECFKSQEEKPTLTMPTISTCIIAKNEASCIARCIEGVLPFSDEVIIYDTGSDDGTQDICRSYEKVKLIQGEWREDFAWARNQSFSYATCDYIMWVDADDVIEPEHALWLKRFKETELDRYTQVDLQYIYDCTENGAFTLMFYRERLFRRENQPVWHGRIHEWVANTVGEQIVYEVPAEDFVIKHYKHAQDPYRNWKIYKDMEEKGEISTARDWFYYGRECMWHESHDSAREKFAKALATNGLWNIDKLNLYMDQRDMCLQEGDTDGALMNALKASVCTPTPRADTCCAIGDWYFGNGSNNVAEYWYKLALEDRNTGIDRTFMSSEYDGFHPALQLCVVEFALGKVEESKRYNELALQFRPDDATALGNKEFFEKA